MRERIKIILCIGFIIICLPIVVTMIFQGEVILPDAQSKSAEENSQQEEDMLAVFVAILAEEIPVTYEREAIKAQAVIVRTNYQYAVRNGEVPEAGLSYSKQVQLFGKEDYTKYYQLLESCIKETGNEVILYQESLVKAPFFSVSAGYTRAGSGYLQAVESKQDITSEHFLTVNFLTPEEFTEQCNAAFPEAGLTAENLSESAAVTEREESGYVKQLSLGEVSVSGEEFRTALALNSSCFSIKVVDGQMRIVTKGLGHGFGLSMYGANELAKEGQDYHDILKYYYSDIEIGEIE